MADPAIIRCEHCEAKLQPTSRPIAGKTIVCPKCGEHFVMQPSEKRRAEKPRQTKRKAVSASAAAADIQHDTVSGSESPSRSAKMPLPGRTRRRQQTPIQAAKEKRNEALKRQEAAEAADRPKRRVLNALSLLLWINAVISVLVLFGHGLFIAGELLVEGDLRETTGPFMVVAICGFAFFMAVWPRERDQQMIAVGIGLFIFFICGVVGVAAANSDEQFSGGLFAVRYTALYTGAAMIIFSGWGYGYETRQGYAERMFASGKYSQAMSTVERILKDDPDNMAAVKLQRELKEVARAF